MNSAEKQQPPHYQKMKHLRFLGGIISKKDDCFLDWVRLESHFRAAARFDFLLLRLRCWHAVLQKMSGLEISKENYLYVPNNRWCPIQFYQRKHNQNIQNERTHLYKKHLTSPSFSLKTKTNKSSHLFSLMLQSCLQCPSSPVPGGQKHHSTRKMKIKHIFYRCTSRVFCILCFKSTSKIQSW